MKKKFIISFIVIISLIIIFSLVFLKKPNITVPNYYSLYEFYYTGDFSEFYKDFYDWYKKMENDSNVYIINSSYYDEEILKSWKENNVYKSIPNNPFWYFTASPTYLKQMNINVDQEIIEEAIKGVRLYLIPDTLNQEDIDIMKSYLKEDAIKNAEKSNIQTTFTKNNDVKIITYRTSNNYFTWPNNKGVKITNNAPIIYVCTSENMKYFESESLIATGVDSLIKFKDKETLDKYSDPNLSQKYNLKFLQSNEIYKNATKSGLVNWGINRVFDK